MATRTISVRVSDDAARTYESASDDERRKLDALLTIQLTQPHQPGRALEEVMNELSRKAEKRGLTREILDDILRGDG